MLFPSSVFTESTMWPVTSQLPFLRGRKREISQVAVAPAFTCPGWNLLPVKSIVRADIGQLAHLLESEVSVRSSYPLIVCEKGLYWSKFLLFCGFCCRWVLSIDLSSLDFHPLNVLFMFFEPDMAEPFQFTGSVNQKVVPPALLWQGKIINGQGNYSKTSQVSSFATIISSPLCLSLLQNFIFKATTKSVHPVCFMLY